MLLSHGQIRDIVRLCGKPATGEREREEGGREGERERKREKDREGGRVELQRGPRVPLTQTDRGITGTSGGLGRGLTTKPL